jgi:membrane-associated phospholipid phosphatase
MKILKRAISRSSTFFIGYLVFIILLSLFCISISKSDGFLLINHFHNSLLDNFFIMFTNVGNGLFVIALMIFMLIRKKIGWTLQIGVSFLISGLFAQLIKHFLPSPRPKLYFGSGTIHCILGVTRTGNSSFPSGHTATIFMLTTLLAIYFPGRKPGLFFFAIAVLTGFSRVYLSQHFPIDVLAGSMVGVLVSMVVYQLIPLKTFKKKFPKNEWEHQSIKLR